MAISKVEKVGRMAGDESSAEPMAWPEYLEWFTVKCPSYQRYLFFFWRRDGGRVGGCLKKLFTKDWNLMEQSGNGCMTLPQRMRGKTRYILLMQMDNQATKWTLGSDSGLFFLSEQAT